MPPLTIPPAVQRDADATQVLGAWVVEEGAHCSVQVGQWHAAGQDEAQAWGVLLADVVRQVADALQAKFGARAGESVDAIVDAFLETLNEPPAGDTD